MRMSRRSTLIACSIAIVLVVAVAMPQVGIATYHGDPGGPGGDGCDDLSSVPPVDPIDFETHIQPIFTNPCTTCHFPGGAAQAGGTDLDLRAGQSYDQLVNVASDQDASWLRIQPFSLANSLLFQKVNCSDPPVGERMPQGGPYLSLQQQALIRDWIVQGALAEPADDPPDPPGQAINFGMSGTWYNQPTSGQGFIFDVVVDQDPPQFVAFWFTFAGEAGGPEGQRWYLAQGGYEDGDHTVMLTVRQSTGGQFDTRPPVPELVDAGVAELEFHSCTEATLTYAMDLDADPDQAAEGVIELTRLSPDVMCQVLSDGGE